MTGALLVLATAVLAWTAWLVSSRAIDVAVDRQLLPRWDLAEHLVSGWTDYYYLVSGRLPALAWDLWGQGYWPPGQSLFQIPFYLLLGGDMRAGLLSSLGAFVATSLAGVATLGLVWGRTAWLPAALFLLFVTTSPFFLAYAAVAMSEMVGAMALAIVLLCHAHYTVTGRAGAASWLAISLTALFFAKYNYFVLLAVPLAGHEYLERTAAWTIRDRIRAASRWVRRWLSTRTGLLLSAYGVVALTVELTGGVAFTVAGQRVAFRTIGYSAHPVLYWLVARLAWRHWRGHVEWSRVWAADPRLRPLTLWFLLPVTLWLVSPYPNHIKDVVNLIVNVPMGEPAALGFGAYLSAVRRDYFLTPWIMAASAAGVIAAMVRYRSQPPVVRLLILTTVMQFVMVALHPTRDARFLLLTMVPWWLVSASELGGAVARWHRPAATAAAAVVLATTFAAVGATVQSAAFSRLAFVNYVDSPALGHALAAIRAAAGHDGAIAVLGRRDQVSPGLIRWHLGPAAGAAAFPVEVERVIDLDTLATARAVVLIAPLDDSTAPPGFVRDSMRDRDRLAPHLGSGALAPVHEYPVDDLNVRLTLYLRQANLAGGR